MDINETILKIRTHCETHRGKERATFSIEGVTALLDYAEALRQENAELLDENTDLKNPQWPAWAKSVLKVIRSHTGYDGYDDATEGVDMPRELEEHLSEMDAETRRIRSRAEKAESEKNGLLQYLQHHTGCDHGVMAIRMLVDRAEEAEAKIKTHECSSRKQGTAGGNDPSDCNWPLCGCDYHANKVIETLQEMGMLNDTAGAGRNLLDGDHQ